LRLALLLSFPPKRTKNQKKSAKIARQTSPPLVRVRGDFSFFVSRGASIFFLLRFSAFYCHQKPKTDQPFATLSARKKE